ncbi:MAG: DUF2029 domain-containing protein [Sandaracinaceae bacterium]|nr:DUF2029 domain-containing protein [Sandaracinaceae bacterium]
MGGASLARPGGAPELSAEELGADESARDARRRALALGARWALVALLGGGTALATLRFALETPPRDAVPAWLMLLGLSSLALALAGVAARGLPRRHLAVATLGVAAMLRLAALFAPVSLSDDVHRYVWDGAALAHGIDPYAHRPIEIVGQAPGLEPARLAALNSPRYHTVYPPVAQLAFATAALAEPSVDGALALRALFGLADLAAIALLFALLDRLGRARAWALFYAWSPLVYWEIAAGGHTEALMVPLLLAATIQALDARPARAGALLGLAVAAKITALVLAPILVVHLARRVGLARALGAALAAALTVALAFLPFASATLVPNLTESLALFGDRFSFNAPVYYALRDALGYVEGERAPVDGVLMPWLAAATLLALSALALWQTGSRERLVVGMACSLLALLLLSRVVHPWYGVAALAFGAAARSPTLVLASVLLPLSYLRYQPFGREEPWVLAVEFVPILVALVLEAAVRARVTPPPPPARARAPARARSPRSPPGTPAPRR